MKSLGFWLCLLATSGVYAVVVLSPKILSNLVLQDRLERNQWQLVHLERDVDRLNKVIEALQHDPAFTREMARVDFHASDPSEQRIPVDEELTLNAVSAAGLGRSASAGLPWYAPLLQVIVDHPGLNHAALLAAAAAIIFAFGFLQEPTGGVDS